MKSVILLTGGTGSFGQAFTKAILRHNIKALRVYSRNEYLQWQMKQTFTDSRIRWMIGDVRDRERLKSCLRGVDYVVHAAALKHLSVGQYNPQEFIKTNILGSMNLVDLAVEMGVKKVLGISSDKAVQPSSLYGSTKQSMEILFMDANRWSLPGTAFSCFRPGNFFESHGNVFELWAKQAENDEKITVTSTDMKRYFIPINDAARVAISCLEVMEGGEIFVPKMTEYSMIQLAKEKYPNGEINVIGKTKGEKLREEIFNPDELPIDKGQYWIIERE